ncbi:uncharacterized protein LOC134882305 [Eleginops maclovinus]|uniref:uncharacterized protein LOC134882305 n=1 Tax=Eleginops maclovinus TaxID=56733 RepID=UPI00307FE2B2
MATPKKSESPTTHEDPDRDRSNSPGLERCVRILSDENALLRRCLDQMREKDSHYHTSSYPPSRRNSMRGYAAGSRSSSPVSQCMETSPRDQQDPRPPWHKLEPTATEGKLHAREREVDEIARGLERMGRPSSRDRRSPDRNYPSRQTSRRRESPPHYSSSSRKDPYLDWPRQHRSRRSSPSREHQYSSIPADYWHDYSSQYKYDTPRGYESSRRREPSYSPGRHSRHPSVEREHSYRGPKPKIPDFVHEDPREFARLKVALDNLLPPDATERFKFQILLDHLKLEEAMLIADSYSHSRDPYTDTMEALTELYGQPHQLALQRISKLMEEPNVKAGDTKAFRQFALKVRALVGMLEQLGSSGRTELWCGSHVSRLLGKLPHDLRASFRRYINPIRTPIPTLLDLADWLEYEVRVQVDGSQFTGDHGKEHQSYKEHRKDRKSQSTMVLHNSEPKECPSQLQSSSSDQPREKPKKFCPFCNTPQHYLNQCANFQLLSKEQIEKWIRANQRCWKCGREHFSSECTLKAKCKKCDKRHLEILHEVNTGGSGKTTTFRKATTGSMERAKPTSSTAETLYVDRPTGSSRVLLKMSRVILKNGENSLDTYALLDDGSERTILLYEAAQQLGLQGLPEELSLRTVRQDVRVIPGATVSFTVSPANQPSKTFHIQRAFTAKELGLAPHTYPVAALKKSYCHLKNLPLQPIDRAQPLLLIGSDHPHLITPTEPVRLGPPGGPAAVKTKLGWALQGPSKLLRHSLTTQQCLWTSSTPTTAELLGHVEKLWQLDTLPYRSEKLVTRSRQDTEAVRILEEKTVRVTVEGVQRYATPLLWKKDLPPLVAPKEAVMAQLRSTEKRLAGDPDKAATYKGEIKKLVEAGYVKKIPLDEAASSPGWYIPHHMVHHNGKNRIVFNCSFSFKGISLNDHLLPGPVLGATLIGVLIRFREHPFAISSDIKGMFHQVRLLPEDQPLLRFLWREMRRNDPPDIYQWQVLPFGTTSSPCCATFALQKHVTDHAGPGDKLRTSVEQCFYVDNCLQSLRTAEGAKQLVDDLRSLLAKGGFDLRQWASNCPSIISHLPPESRSESSELWFNHDTADPEERTLGLIWHCQLDSIGFKHGQLELDPQPTMRSIYRTLAKQYDPLGFIVPFTTRAKILVQRLWDRKREWDDPDLPQDLLQAWSSWVEELPQLSSITLPRCYTAGELDLTTCNRSVHVFCDASEKAYGSVAYLRTQDGSGRTQVAFIAARSRVAPKRQLSIPRLELCAAVTGAQLASVLKRELTLDIHCYTYWTDSTTVLTWLNSESCKYKVFVGTRIAEIQELTDAETWRYVDTQRNPADDITRGKTLSQLAECPHWFQGPDFLRQPETSWPEQPSGNPAEVPEEMRKQTFCGATTVDSGPPLLDIGQYSTFQELLEAVACSPHGVASDTESTSAADLRKAELDVLRQAQIESFPDDMTQLLSGNPVTSNSKLVTLAPELDPNTQLIHVGGRLRRCDQLSQEVQHPIVLDPSHPLSKLIIKRYDQDLHHPGPERVFAEIRRRFWILRGRQAIRKFQHSCPECRKWRGTPEVPRMADLPPSSLRLYKPAFYSTGIDCFGPFQIRVGRRNEKRWGILYKCLTTKAVYIDLLASIDSDSFLMSLRRFVSRRGKPHEILCDNGTNFKGGDTELKEAFQALQPALKEQLTAQQIAFQYNPPSAPHFGGSWEREIRSIKAALYTVVGAQTVPEEVLRTVLVEIEGILNSKPLGYVSSDVSDPDPVTPNTLLMGRPDSSLPQVIYPESELLTRRRWRHSQVLADQFWSRFIRQYLPAQQTRQKWQKEKDDLTVGTVVMIVDPQSPRALWLVGTVKTVCPGSDGRVRAAEVKVKDRTYLRPVARLIKLPAFPDDHGEKDF